MRRPIIAAILLFGSQPASASTPEAWAALKRQAERSCVAASSFRRPRVSNMIVFDDTIGKVALLVTGTFTLARGRPATGTNLCLYDRRTRRAAVEEAKGWSERR